MVPFPLFLSLAAAFLECTPSESPDRPRILILTDVSSLTAGIAEPDDGQSLIRLMLYTNDFDIEGLIATSNLGHQQKTRPDLVRQVVDAYGKVQSNLLLHDRRYPAAASLRAKIKSGQPFAGRKTPVDQCVGEGKDTEASDWIIQVVDQPDPRPVWALIWGGSTDLAQALWKVRRTRKPDELDQFLSRLRVHSINDQDSTGPWIRVQFPALFTITQRFAYRGMYRGGDRSLVSSAWVGNHIHGHGPLGDLYPDYNGGDIWSSRLGQVRGIKEGDTPSFLSLAPNGLSDADHPWLGSWGGRFEADDKHLVDIPDTDIDSTSDPDPRMSSVYRWRPAFQADFQARLDWCVKPFDGANHPPKVSIAGKRERAATPGEVITLDASGTNDPDDDRLTFAWSVYPVGPGSANEVTVDGRNERIARVALSPRLTGKILPILLIVTDQGSPPLTRYARVLVTIPKSASRRSSSN
jgi:Protein of unknown function (DUF1593)